jgi:hypothetical protein
MNDLPIGTSAVSEVIAPDFDIAFGQLESLLANCQTLGNNDA